MRKVIFRETLNEVSVGVTPLMSEGHGESFEELKARLEAALKRITELEGQKPADSAPSAPSRPEPQMDMAPLSEADATLRRLVQRIAMILQAEKIAIMFYDREIGELRGIPPAYGIDEEHLNHFRVRATHGISGLVFREGEPIICHDTVKDERTDKDPFTLLHVQNCITVPLIIEKRDEENRVLDRTTIGVLHAFNKRHGEDFNEEDVRLLERMAKNVGAIIANLQLYREVVEEREELLQTIESLNAGLILVSPEYRVSQINSSARAIFSVGSDALGKPLQETIPIKELEDIVRASLGGEESPHREIEVQLKGQERFFQVQAALVRNEEGRDLGVVCIFNDITEMKQIDKMKSSFVAMASHELRTPLTAIKGFSSTLLDGLDYDMYGKEEQREFLGIVVQECDRLRRLIDDLLNTSRIEAGESLKPNYSEVKLSQLLDKVVLIQRQATTKHQITLAAEGPIPDIVGDEDKLDQILTNLLNNAIKYSPNGGVITVHAKRDGEEMLIGVQDQGMGIPKDHVAKVFEKFHRVNNEDNRKIYGTGLGLYLVKHLVESVHFGKIWAESEVGVGSTFWFRIPVHFDIEEAKQLQ